MSLRDQHRGTRLGTILALAVFAGLIVSLPAQAQLGQGRMQGTVTDSEGNPLEGVEVTAHNPNVTPSTLETTTDEKGNWAIMGFTNDTWSFTFEKDGYVPRKLDASVRMLSRNPDMDVALQKAAPASGAGGEGGAGAVAREKFDEGSAAFDAGDYQVAIEAWTEFAEANPELFQIWVNIGNAHRRLGNAEEARAAYDKVLAEDPADTRAHYNLGEMAIEDDDLEAALPHFEAVIESNPEDPAVYYNVGEIYFENRNTDRAIEFYQQALEIDPGFAPAQVQLGYAYINKGDMESAIAAFERYLEMVPADSQDAAVVRDIVAALKEGA